MRALRPPRVVFVMGVASLINSLTSGKKAPRNVGQPGTRAPLRVGHTHVATHFTALNFTRSLARTLYFTATALTRAPAVSATFGE